MNLLKETVGKMADAGKSPDDVRWVGVLPSSLAPDMPAPVGSWAQFEEWALDYNYDDGYGSAEVNPSLVIVGDDWWLERNEYDGSEWWEFKSLPNKPELTTPLQPSDLEIKHRR